MAQEIDMEKISKAYSDYGKALKELEKARRAIANTVEDAPRCWRGINIEYWKDLCKKFGDKNLINNYGDVFFIEENHEKWFICRRVNWGMGLSLQRYQVEEFDDSSDGEYGGVDYEVTLIEEE